MIFPVHLVHKRHLVPFSQIFTYGRESEPPSPAHDSPIERVTPKVKPKPRDNPPNLVPNVPADPDSDPSLSYSSLADSSDSSDGYDYKRRRCAKRNKKKE